MQRGSSGNKTRKKKKRPNGSPQGRVQRDNVYELNRIRQKRESESRYYGRTQPQPAPRVHQRPVQPKKAQHRAVQHQKPSKATVKRRRNYAGRILPLFVFGVIALYLVAQLMMMAVKKPEINVETVSYGTIDTPVSRQGVIVRDEYVVKSDRAGTPFYQYSEGDYVTKSSVVCQVKDTASTNVLEEKLQSIDKDILESQKSRSDLSAFSEDIARIENNMGNTVEMFGSRSMKTDASYLYSMRTQLDSYIMQRNEIWLSEDVESLSQLSEQRSSYEQQLSQSMSSVTAPESGVLAFSYDGLEETLTTEALEEITVGQVSGSEKMAYISKVKNVEQGDPLFRIVRSNRWYIVSNFPANEVLDWKVGDKKKLNLINEDSTTAVSATVYAITPGETETKVVFSCFTHMDQFINSRTISFSLESEAVEGLKIPNNAIVEKSLLKIPLDCLTESGGNQGVLLINGDNSKFIPTTIISSDDSYAYLAQSDQSLKLGDVILQGTGETAGQYTVAEVETMAGVYVANSSMAKFVPITVLEQNQEYAIVKSNSNYGLQVYDTIVSDAKNITEGQSIY
ncbi:HlyD family efflux transporter periplasmic adaptor subunit [Anaerotignum sp.]|uniref:HlyD family efflux transporter periplasmic adaptor subunit n=1 Tax=Anaerotignum sp. TaxID=2039241 RepID=UPI002A91332C|nr:HlyD family efflux transporter periplasmic adaptor subunit [Anaerotignum sp.]MCI7657416.1 hypothetical protein [Clostridia bacterium]MDY5414512.1 HlyD family efflux transporter periplasmic adaptor subunit [Anaerotignum sp.]